MTDVPSDPLAPVFTVGHSNQPSDLFLHLLTAQGIEVVVDVRSVPQSRYAPQFNRETLRAALLHAGFKYLFLGDALGGRPQGAEFYDAEGHTLYGRVAVAPFFLEGIRRVESGLRTYRVALMCSEEDPTDCHRRLLLARVLGERGVAVQHIRGDGRLQGEADLAGAPGDGGAGQLALFAPEEVTVWRSVRSVLPKSGPPNSSER